MVNVENFFNCLKSCGISMFTGVPDSLLKDFCAYITDHSDTNHNIIAANEGAAIGIAAGHHIATSEIPVVYMQNSGIGNAINPLLSLADEKVYSIPLILVIGWRGEPGIPDEPQHLKQGEVTLRLLDAMEIPYIILDSSESTALKETESLIAACKLKNKPHAIIIRKGTFAKYNLKTIVKNDFPVTREQALKIVIDCLSKEDMTVSTTGKLSRELFEYREALHQGHNKDFLTVGSMGHSSSIALGIALSHPERKIWILDGDGAFIMHMGSTTTIAKATPDNIVHVVFNNGAHESVGGQPTVGFDINIPEIAKGVGYKFATSVDNITDIKQVLQAIDAIEKPALIELKVGINSRKDLGRPTTSPIENKIVYMRELQK